MENITVNRLPARTWSRLGVNEASLSWDASREAALPDESHAACGGAESARIAVRGADEYNSKKISLSAADGGELTVFMDLTAAGKLAVYTDVAVQSGARVRLVQLISPDEGGTVYSRVGVNCAQGGRMELTQILLGRGDVYSDSHTVLAGDHSALKAGFGYLGCGGQRLDINLAADHFGKSTASEIEANGALKDAAQKIFRGTIDFKTGSSGSTGDEKETVLMLGDDTVNKTVPLILCAEENVAGNHGATIGELDDATLFYFESRGIDRAQAENIMARAAVERLARAAGDEEFEKLVMSRLSEVL